MVSFMYPNKPNWSSRNANAEDASCVVKLNLLSYLYDKTVNMTIQSYYDRLDSAESSKQWSLRIINYLSC